MADRWLGPPDLPTAVLVATTLLRSDDGPATPLVARLRNEPVVGLYGVGVVRGRCGWDKQGGLTTAKRAAYTELQSNTYQWEFLLTRIASTTILPTWPWLRDQSR